MAIPSITSGDFTGAINISQTNWATTDFNLAIPGYTREFLLTFLGNEAYTDIDQNTRSRWDTFFGGTTWTKDEKTYTLLSVTEAIQNWIYAKYVFRQKYVNSATGNVANFNENSEMATGATNGAIGSERLNWAYIIWEGARAFLSEFRSVTRDIVSATGTGTIVVTVSSTDYLEDGDSVDINGTSYTVSSVTGTTFEVAAASGAGWQSVAWTPFGVVCEHIPSIQIGFY